jgi:hypothetical protein
MKKSNIVYPYRYPGYPNLHSMFGAFPTFVLSERESNTSPLPGQLPLPTMRENGNSIMGCNYIFLNLVL